MEAGEDGIEIAKEALTKHWKVIFNGNGYDPDSQAMLTENNVWSIDSGVEAHRRLFAQKNTELFDKMGVMSKEESIAREGILHDHYTGTVDIEAETMIDMINQHIIPSVKAAGKGPLKDLEKAVDTLKTALHEIQDAKDGYEMAKLARVLRLETMDEIRKICDAAEDVVPSNLWTLATYKELLFLDSHVNNVFI